MRRALYGTLAGWLTGAAGLMAQVPPPPQRPIEPPAPPEQVAPAPYQQQVAPYQQVPYQQYQPNTGRPSYYQGPGMEDQRQPMPPSYGPMMGAQMPGNFAYGPPMNAPMMRGPLLGGYPTNAAMMRGPMMINQGEVMPQPNPGVPMQPMQPGYDPRMAGPSNFAPGYYGQNGGGWSDGGDGGDGCWNGNCWNRCPCGACGPEGRTWASAELLFFWTRGQNLPPLVTRGVDATNPGIIGQAGTTILFGNSAVGQDLRMGVRARAGFWIDECQMLGLEGSFFFLANREINFMQDCQVGDVISRPFFNADPNVNAQDAELVCQPGVLCGHVTVTAFNEMYGADANFRRNLCCTPTYRIDLVGGFRYMHLYDDLQIQENLTNLDPNRGAIGEGFLITDRFQARNDFYGGQIGAAGEFRSGQFFLDWRGLVGLGSTTRTVIIGGTTTFLDPVPGGNPATQPGGLLAQQSNIGTFTSNQFSVIPEMNLNLGMNVTPNLRVWAGYTFMYWNNVMRAGEQIDLNVDATQIPTRAAPGPLGTQPAFLAKVNDVWIQGLSLGVQLRY
jgi:hypothetical protein